MSRIKTIPAAPQQEVTQRVNGVFIDYDREIIKVRYENVETGTIEKVNLPSGVFDAIVTALNPDRLWTYIDNNS